MSFFGSLSEIIASLSPRRRQPEDRQRTSAVRRRAHPPSLTPRARPFRAKSDGNQFSLGLDTEDDDLDEDFSPQNREISTLPQAAHSYADQSPPPTDTPIARGQLRHSTSQFAFEPSTRLGRPSQMLSKDQQQNDAQARQDEARLLGANYKDSPGAVIITPGATLHGKGKKTPGSSAAFKPTDKISRHFHESGPVRAQGKSKPVASYLRQNPPRLDDAFEFEESSRPSKRRRQGGSGKVIDLADEDVTDPVSSVMELSPPSSQLSPCLSPGSNLYSTKSKSRGRGARKLDEYRGVEDSVRVSHSPRRRRHLGFSSGGSQDELFTESAARQRRSLTSNADPQSPDANNKADRPPRREVLESVEIPKTNESASATLDRTSSYPRQSAVSGKAHLSSSTRESPDELQGEVTTHPVPKSLHEKHNHAYRKTKDDTQPESPVRKHSPTDIRPTTFTGSSRQVPRKPKNSHSDSSQWPLHILSLRFGPYKKSVAKEENVALHMNRECIELGEDIIGPGKRTSILFRHIRQVVQGQDPSRKVRIRLSKSDDAPSDVVDIEFSTTQDKERLFQVLQDPHIKIQDREMSYMDKAFDNHERELAQHGNHAKKPFLEDSTVKPVPTPPANSSTRRKLSASLQDANGEPSEQNSLHLPQTNRENSKFADGVGQPRQTSGGRKLDTDSGVEIPVKSFRPNQLPSERETRSMARRAPRLSERPDGGSTLSDDVRQSPSKRDLPGKKWPNALVYPRTGKKKAEVSFEDRDRLREGEFLNDNLIGFYMRFLQDHLERTNKKVAKQIYFFNSYFFATLTNTAKGDRGINYGGVEKWTRNVDLFRYNYVVVPINENAHWYVAIICNLPSLSLGSAERVEPNQASSDKELSNQPESEVQDITETPEPEPDAAAAALKPVPKQVPESPQEQETRRSLASMSLLGDRRTQNDSDKQEQPAPAEEWPEGEENPTSSSAKFSKTDQAVSSETHDQSVSASQPARKPKKKVRTGPKLDPSQTTIITFDSLDLARSPTIKVLREYICKEAASKRGVEVEPSSVKGMRARQIPLQPNYSDCGLYLLAYVEKFVQDPDPFITKLLRREMDAKSDWPPLGSGLLRHRLRNFLDELYEEQVRANREKTDGQPIMAEQRPVSFLLGPPLPSPEEKAGDQTHSVPPQPAGSPRAEQSIEKLAMDDSAARQSEEPDAESPTADPLELVPTGEVSDVVRNNGPTEPSAAGVSHVKDQEVIEVPDSQEAIQVPASHQEREPSRKDEKIPRQDMSNVSTGRKSDGKKAVDADVRTSNVPRADRHADDVQVEVQIRRTPPPTESGRVRRSPRGVARRG